MPQLDWKHMTAFGIGVILTLLGAFFGIDFSKSCPQSPVAASVVAPPGIPSSVPSPLVK